MPEFDCCVCSRQPPLNVHEVVIFLQWGSDVKRFCFVSIFSYVRFYGGGCGLCVGFVEDFYDVLIEFGGK